MRLWVLWAFQGVWLLARSVVATALACALASGLACALEAQAQTGQRPALRVAEPRTLEATGQALFLVATRRLADARYRRTVILIIPRKGERHVGLIINRPTSRSMASLFPDHEPSRRVADPVYYGGPMSEDTLLALLRTESSPDPRSIELLPGLFLLQGAPTIDQVIENTPNDARYYAGLVLWRSGELRSELRRGLWQVCSADVHTLFRKDPSRVWRELLEQTERINAGIYGARLASAIDSTQAATFSGIFSNRIEPRSRWTFTVSRAANRPSRSALDSGFSSSD